MPPNDPRLLALTGIEISLEQDASLWLDEKPLRRCDNCNVYTYRDLCPICFDEELKAGPTGDPVIDDILTRKEKGEKVSLGDYFKINADGSYSGPAFELENQ